jgi:hypothetical protein
VAKSEYSLKTKQMLGLFLSFIMIFVLAGLYIDAHQKVTLLQQDVARLTASQVLLMVPEEQAANIADWLTMHPEQTQAIIVDKVKFDIDTPAKWKDQEIVMSENDQGVKVIRLPNGGIRVTTRDDKQDKH